MSLVKRKAFLVYFLLMSVMVVMVVSNPDVVQDEIRKDSKIMAEVVKEVAMEEENNKYDPNNKNNTNITNSYESHKYYTSQFVPVGKSHFRDVRDMSDTEVTVTKQDDMSSGKKNLLNADLRFEFPFYGHTVKSFLVTSKGFIHVGPMQHNFMYATHYLAPLMANFDASLNNHSSVYIANGTKFFIVQWNDMLINFKNSNKTSNSFTFQVILYENGTMVFAYKDIGMDLTNLKKVSLFPINIGMSDGFILHYKYMSRRKIRFYHKYIYSYHKIKLSLDKVNNNSAFVLNPLPNCIMHKTCESCLNANLTFQCKWCPTVQRCSDSFDWHRQSWLENKCHLYGLLKRDVGKCSLPIKNKEDSKKPEAKRIYTGSVTTAHVVGILIAVVIVMLVIGLIAFIYYAYKHPQSKAGMWLIEHRPRKVLRSFSRVPYQDDMSLINT